MKRTLTTTATWLIVLSASAPVMVSASERIDLNAATVEQLVELPHIGPVHAKRIVAMRERNGPFRCVEELRALPRLPEKYLQEILPLVKVSGANRPDCKALERARRRGEDAAGASSEASGSI